MVMLHLTGDVNTKAPYWPGKRTIELTVCLFFIMLIDMYDHKITCNIYMNHRKAGGRFEHGLSQLIIEVVCAHLTQSTFLERSVKGCKETCGHTCVPVNLTCVPNLDVLACSHKSTHHNNHGAAPWCRLKRVPCFQMTLRLMLN